MPAGTVYRHVSRGACRHTKNGEQSQHKTIAEGNLVKQPIRPRDPVVLSRGVMILKKFPEEQRGPLPGASQLQFTMLGSGRDLLSLLLW